LGAHARNAFSRRWARLLPGLEQGTEQFAFFALDALHMAFTPERSIRA